MSAPDPAAVEPITDAIWPTVSAALGGLDPGLQGAVLADLVATWLAGFTGDKPAAVDRLREELLALHVDTVRELIPINEARLIGRVARRI
jgi:hypothetical protein